MLGQKAAELLEAWQYRHLQAHVLGLLVPELCRGQTRCCRVCQPSRVNLPGTRCLKGPRTRAAGEVLPGAQPPRWEAA